MTVHTRLGADADRILDPFSELMNRAERTLHARLIAGAKWTGYLAISLYKEFGISAKLIESVYAARQAKVSSALELAKLHAGEIDKKITSKTKQIADKERKLVKKRKELANSIELAEKHEARAAKLLAGLATIPIAKKPLALQQYKTILGEMHRCRRLASEALILIESLDADIHQHKRRVETLRAKLDEAKRRIEHPSICFGTRKLFDAQHNLEANGFKSHSEWREAWRRSRSATFMIEGDRSRNCGNRFARLSRRDDGLFDIELRLPEALKDFAAEATKVGGNLVHSVRFNGLAFSHNPDLLDAAISGRIPVSVRFHRDDTSWRVMVSFKTSDAEIPEDYRCGAIGVDLNADFVSVTRVDRHGNVVEALDIPMVTYGKSQAQSRDVTCKVAAEIVAYAKKHGLPIVSEELDFEKKKLVLKLEGDARYARMLSSFAYSQFDAALASACARHGVFHKRVNPAYTSLIGRVKFARRYGLSVHRSAALAIARRAMQLSEELPLSFRESGKLTLPLNDAHPVTLELPVRKDPAQPKAVGSRHVGPDLKGVAKALRGALAARGPSRRKRPSRSVMGWGELRSMVRRRRRDVPGADTQSGSQRVAPMRSPA
ncbi:IS200/IS605 family element transposase accessory protein TnpB [Rhizobium laguerreae]|uniref:IS200/IS605 family accessory protein TnpB-related protein n=1 Tax=Rhizobium laguerreae TaxID=1076926 RepID=UPI001C8FB92A|nr:IS200/IS605 family accessory protein TnpB-related protein [Rhizobium laguerreae]MBY3150940.1 IS200/IS605 family element transposase accessory protein TnpB [Rhizobium laguerreae]